MHFLRSQSFSSFANIALAAINMLAFEQAAEQAPQSLIGLAHGIPRI